MALGPGNTFTASRLADAYRSQSQPMWHLFRPSRKVVLRTLMDFLLGHSALWDSLVGEPGRGSEAHPSAVGAGGVNETRRLCTTVI